MSGTFYSQFGEDQTLSRIFVGRSSGTCVEVGANDGVHGSTTLFFEKVGWRCVLVEPNPELCAELRAIRRAVVLEYAASNSVGSATLHVAEGAWRADGMSTISSRAEPLARISEQGFRTRAVQVRTSTMDLLLNEGHLEGPIDFVTIDVEGHELEVLEGFTVDRWKPTVLIIEDNSNTEDVRVQEYLARFGYEPFLRTGVNDWFAHRSNKQLVNVSSKVRFWTKVAAIRTRSRLRRIGWLRSCWRRLRAWTQGTTKSA